MDSDIRAKVEKQFEKKRKRDHRKYMVQKLLFRLGNKPMQYKEREVPDFNRRCEQLRGFREAYQRFFLENLAENSELQKHTTQLLWHRLYLQKLRLNKYDLTMKMESTRVKRTRYDRDSVKEDSSFDGRYQVSDVNEAIAAKRVFLYHGKNIGTFDNHESLNYQILSAKAQGTSQILCPNCGNVASRENLIDGCDFCGTVFTVEDLEDKVGGFDFQYEFAVKGSSEKTWEAHRIFAQGDAMQVQEYDPNFSIREFSENVFNKLAAIHYADSFEQINAFSDNSLSHLLDDYKNVVNMDPWDIRFVLKRDEAYVVENGMQKVKCHAMFTLFELIDGKIAIRDEDAIVTLEKSAACKTQAVCGPSVFKCKGCGASMSLLEGKTCPYCGREINMRDYDWVITGYESTLRPYRKSLYEI